MSGIGAAIIGGSAITGLLSSNAQKNAAQNAANAQLTANQNALNAQNQLFNNAMGYQNNALTQGNALANNQQSQLQNLFAPYVQAGQQALGGMGQYASGGLQAFQQQQALSGALGNDAQTQAMSGIQNSSMFRGLAQQGENAILQNASATGGLRGGNTQAALAQFQPALLNQLLQQQFSNLGGLSALGSQNYGTMAGLGQGSASGQAQGGLGILQSQLGLQGQIAGNAANLAGANTQAVTGLMGQQGAINAGNILSQGKADTGLFGNLGNAINLVSMLGAQGFLGGTPSGGSRALATGLASTAQPFSNFSFPDTGAGLMARFGVNW